MDAAAITMRARIRAERIMADTCTIRRLGGLATDPVTGIVTPTYTTVYTGPCRLRRSQAIHPESVEAGAVVVEVRDMLHIPMSVTGVRSDDVAEVTASQLDPDLLGRRWRVVGESRGSFQSSRHLQVEETQ